MRSDDDADVLRGRGSRNSSRRNADAADCFVFRAADDADYFEFRDADAADYLCSRDADAADLHAFTERRCRGFTCVHGTRMPRILIITARTSG